MLYYWDASALVSLCVAEEDTGVLRQIAANGIVTWAASRVEIASAIERRSRDGLFGPDQRRAAFGMLQELADAWTEIQAVAPVCERAMRVLAVHPLRAADAMQLAAALIAVADQPRGHHFVCSDQRLGNAAGREGFSLLPRQ